MAENAALKSGKNPNCDCTCPVRQEAPDPPTSLPEGLEATEENVPALQKWIEEYYAASAFCTCDAMRLSA